MDPAGNNISYKRYDSLCNGELLRFLPNLKAGAQSKTRSGYTFAEFFRLINPYNGDFRLHDNSYKVVILWARWLGRVNKNYLVPSEKLARENKNVTIDVIKLDMDFRNKRFFGKP